MTSNSITDKKMLSAGQILSLRRNELRISIEQATEETKVQKKYLQQIEDDAYDLFESEVFLSGYIKIYASYLGLNVDKILAIYRRSQNSKQKSSETLAKEPDTKQALSPRAIGITLLLLSVLAVIIYFSFQLYNFQRLPELNITSPENNTEVVESTLTIEGRTDTNAYITINDARIEKLSDQLFTSNIDLVDGVNTITVKAVRENNQSKETVAILTIIYNQKEVEPEDQEEIKVEPVVINNKFRMKIQGSDAWVNLTIDDKQEIVGILNSGFEEEYEIEKSFTIVSGKISATEIILSNSESAVKWSSSDGVGTITCTLDNNLINCDN